MKIIHISTSDKIGGAALAAYRLNNAFNQASITSELIVLNQHSILHKDVISIAKGEKKYLSKLKLKVTEFIKKRLLRPNYTISLGWCGYDLCKTKELIEADVIYIHWTGLGYLSIRGLARILDLNKPTFIYMHDMWFITGGCHHSFECYLYKSQCSKCPRIGNNKLNFIVTITFKLKQRYLTKYNNLHIITPSNWLADCVKQSALFKSNNIYVIPNSIDTQSFKPICKQTAREILNLPQNKKIILFGANGGKSDKYKGWDYLVSAISQIDRDDVIIALFGGNISEEDKKLLKYSIYSFGYLYDEYSTILLYNAADVFVIPSLAENFPNTIVESLSCGTPVVGFNVGGIPDLIKHHQTGYLAKYKDVNDLAIGINWILNNSFDKDKLHNYITEKYSYLNIISQHMDYISKLH